jgi:tetratricopeptide (TPR) repeat protein
MRSTLTQASLIIGCFLLSVSISGCIKNDWKSSYDRGEEYYRDEHYDYAERAFKTAVAKAENQKPMRGSLPMSLNALANVYRDQPEHRFYEGRQILGGVSSTESPNYQKSLVLYKRSIALWIELAGREFSGTADAEADLGRLYVQTGNYKEAEPLLKHAVAVLNKNICGFEKPRPWEDLAEVYRKHGKFAEAELVLNQSIAAREKKCPESTLEETLLILASIYTEDHKYAEAELVYKRIIKTNNSWHIASVYREYADLLEKANRPKEAAEAIAKAKINAKKSFYGSE